MPVKRIVITFQIKIKTHTNVVSLQKTIKKRKCTFKFKQATSPDICTYLFLQINIEHSLVF